MIPLISQKDCRNRFSKLLYKNLGNEKGIVQKNISKKFQQVKSSHKNRNFLNSLISFVISPIFTSSLEKTVLKPFLGADFSCSASFSSEPLVIWKSKSKSQSQESFKVRKRIISEKSQKFAVLHSLYPDVFWRIIPISSFPKLKDYSLLGLNVWKKIPREKRDDDLDRSYVDQLSERFEIEKAKRELIRREKSFSLYSSNGVSRDTFKKLNLGPI